MQNGPLQFDREKFKYLLAYFAPGYKYLSLSVCKREPSKPLVIHSRMHI